MWDEMVTEGDGEEEEEGTSSPRERFTVDIRPMTHADTVVLAIAGELDRDTMEPLRKAVEEHLGAGRIVVDCSALRFCDSSGLNTLLRARLRMQEAGGRLELAEIRRPVARMFEITGARSVFRVYETVAEALSERGHEGGGIHGRER
ncbi:STAS domain-containing protein [Streptomyces sp. NPDC050842]|uniref:STAS domain-containing protein n=1 Tax=Streptomyces sp. NPDC050842 TaxID=3365636 RepID=UPI0037BC0A32